MLYQNYYLYLFPQGAAYLSSYMGLLGVISSLVYSPIISRFKSRQGALMFYAMLALVCRNLIALFTVAFCCFSLIFFVSFLVCLLLLFYFLLIILCFCFALLLYFIFYLLLCVFTKMISDFACSLVPNLLGYMIVLPFSSLGHMCYTTTILSLFTRSFESSETGLAMGVSGSVNRYTSFNLFLFFCISFSFFFL